MSCVWMRLRRQSGRRICSPCLAVQQPSCSALRYLHRLVDDNSTACWVERTIEILAPRKEGNLYCSASCDDSSGSTEACHCESALNLEVGLRLLCQDPCSCGRTITAASSTREEAIRTLFYCHLMIISSTACTRTGKI